ncbi:MAG: helix-turn-helix transcriptional regulator [Burkholderiaceae bacterium]|jgi:transcriptional regulator with XRE-family HTH domain
MAKTTRHHSSATLDAIQVFALQIQLARKQRRWSESELAERAGTTRPTIRQIEQGNPATSLGLYFEVATLLGIPLFSGDERQLIATKNSLAYQLSLLPKRIDKPRGEVFDDF